MEKYITEEDYLKEKGVKLSLEIQDDDNPSNKVHRFIRETTNWCIEHLVINYGCNELLRCFDTLPEWRQQFFREGVMEQIEYLLNEGWVNKDSGYNRDTGAVVDLSGVELCRTAFNKFKLGAFCNITRY